MSRREFDPGPCANCPRLYPSLQQMADMDTRLAYITDFAFQDEVENDEVARQWARDLIVEMALDEEQLEKLDIAEYADDGLVMLRKIVNPYSDFVRFKKAEIAAKLSRYITECNGPRLMSDYDRSNPELPTFLTATICNSPLSPVESIELARITRTPLDQ